LPHLVYFGAEAEQDDNDGRRLDAEQSNDRDVELILRSNVLLELGQLQQQSAIIKHTRTHRHMHTKKLALVILALLHCSCWHTGFSARTNSPRNVDTACITNQTWRVTSRE